MSLPGEGARTGTQSDPQRTGVQGLAAIVTGGASGIGACVVEQLVAGGARVAILDRTAVTASSTDDSTSEATNEATNGAGSAPLSYLCDIGDDAAVRAAVEQAATDLGGVDIVVNCAGIGAAGDIAANDDEEWRRVLDVNVLGIARVTRAALPHLRRSEAASVVNIGSIAATQGLPDRALYSASKGAVHALTRAMACDFLDEGIRVNAVAPGTADTPWVGRLLDAADDPEAERAALNARQPHGRLVTAAEVASAVVYLAGRSAGSTNALCLAVDGGMDNVVRRPRPA